MVLLTLVFVTSLQVACGMLFQRYTKVVLALCLLLVLWQCF